MTEVDYFKTIQTYPTVYNVFRGFTDVEKSSWFVSSNVKIRFQADYTIYYNYLVVNNDTVPTAYERMFYELSGKKGDIKYVIIDKAIPFSLSVTCYDENFQLYAINKIKNNISTGQTSKLLFISELDDKLSEWIALPESTAPISSPSIPFLYNGISYSDVQINFISSGIVSPLPSHKLYPATNTLWDNFLINGINNFDNDKYYLGDGYVFNRYFKLNAVEDDLFNEDDMTNPYTLEIHKALNAGKYSKNEIEPTKERFTTLGYYVEKVASLLGHRLTPSGRIDYQDEADNQAMLVNNPQFKPGDQSYSRYLFALKGMLLSSTPTHYDAKGRLGELMWRVRDIPQLLAAKEHDLDKSIGIEQGSQIRIPGENGKVLGYNNQLELLLDLHDRIRKIELRAEETYRNTLVTGEQVKGLMSGLGLPLTLENYPIKGLDGKSKAILPYYNYSIGQPNILSHLTIIKSNLGIVQGVLMPQKKPPNPWERWKVGAVEGKIK